MKTTIIHLAPVKMAAPMMLPQMKTAKFIAHCLERRGLLPLLTTQLRFKMTSRKRLRDPTESNKDKKFTPQMQFRKRNLEINTEVKQKPVKFIAEKPVDDVWISTYYPEPKYALGEIIERHKEYAQPAMFNMLHSRIYADMDINMRTKKQTKFVQSVKNTIEAPYPFQTGVKQNVIVLCQEKKNIALALELGATRAGGADLVKLIKDGVIKKTDFDHLLATPDMIPDIMTLRGVLKEETPEARKGKVSDDLEKMVTFYVRGITYEVTKVSDALGKLQIPFGTLDMSVECLEENFNICIDAINAHKPGSAPGVFISNMTIIAPPSPERYILQASDYAPDRHKVKQDGATDEDSDDSDDEEVMVKRKARR